MGTIDPPSTFESLNLSDATRPRVIRSEPLAPCKGRLSWWASQGERVTNAQELRAKLTERMLERGFGEDEVRKIWDLNWIRVYEQVWKE